MADIIDSCDIKPSYRSDHSIIEIKITMDNFIRGCGTWKLNNSLLKNRDYLDLIGNIIDQEKLKYCLPVYNINFILDSFNNLQFSIDDDTFLEMLFLRIRGESLHQI